MLTATLLGLSSITPLSFLLDSSSNAQSRLLSERITAKSIIYSTTGTLETSYLIDVKRDQSARIQLPPATNKPYPEHYFFDVKSSPALAFAYQPNSGQYTRSEGRQIPLPEFIAAANPQFDEFLTAFLTKDGIKSVISRLDLASNNWRISRTSTAISLKYTAKEATTEVKLNPKSKRIVEFNSGNAAGAISWKFTYGTYSPYSLPPKVKDAYEVSQFDDLIGKAQTANSVTDSSLKKLFAAYEPNQSIAYTTTTKSETVRVYFSPKLVAQSDNLTTWTYDGKTVQILDKATNRYYEGPATRDTLLDAVAQIGSRVEVNLRSLIIGRNPMRLLLNDYSTAKTTSKITSPERAEVISAESLFADLKLTVSQRDGFLLKIESTPIGMRGDRLPTTTTTFKRESGQFIKLTRPNSAQVRSITELSN